MAGIDAGMLKTMFLSSACALNDKKDWINELNVFPVPDGDTGTNMTMTIMAAAREVQESTDGGMEAICRAISSGSLRGARGNSGVILSQLLRGFTRSVRELSEITVPDAAEAFQRAAESAFKAVMKPKEGTILTVAREMADRAAGLKDMEDGIRFFSEVVKAGDEALARTPEMLPVLKQAGVVDSGGQGLMVLLHECLDILLGKTVEIGKLPEMSSGSAAEVRVDTADLDTADIRFGYCTEFIIDTGENCTDAGTADLRTYLESIGDSIVVVADEGIVKVHVHTNDPGLAIQKALSLGSLSRIKIDNMRLEHEERLFRNGEVKAASEKSAEESVLPEKENGFAAVCAGEGLSRIFRDLGVDQIISGGQTMNPSTEDILSAVKRVNAKTVYVLPNNKNIVLAATQAAGLIEDRNVIVVPAKTVAEGISAMISYMPDVMPEENLEAMQESISRVKTLEVTYAVRDTVLDGVSVHKGDYMALGSTGLAASGALLEDVVRAAVEKNVDEDSAVVSLYYGSDITEKDAEEMAEALSDAVCDAEIEVHYGGQPVYYYIISIE